jgi:crotonobetainyl-CoA:carnitine CoA-transferase CaiB-like acyl-CoA transferase
MPFAVNDYCTGLLGAFGLGLALFNRERTGEGQHVATSLAAAGTFLQTAFMQQYEGKKWDEPTGPDAVGWSPLQRLYRASDGWLFLGARPSQLGALARLQGLIAIDKLEGAELEDALARAIATRPAGDWVRDFTAAGAGAHAVVPVVPLMKDPRVVEHGLSVTRTHKGGEVITTIGAVPRLSRTPVEPGRPASPPGADAREVLAKARLEDKYEEYVRRGIIAVE